jgi:1,4-alpha-glucan branching enzyme
MPSMSSWGYQGYSETWLMGRNHWIYPQLYAAVEDFEHLFTLFPSPQADIRLALNQYLRELLLAQSSDWAFILHQETAQEYATGRVKAHIENMTRIYQQLLCQMPDRQWLIALQKGTPLFPEMDLLTYYRQSGSFNA